LERVDAILGVVGHHGEVGGGRLGGGGYFEGCSGVGGEEPGGKDWTAAAAVEGGAAGMVDAAEELVGEVEAADLVAGLGRVCGDGVERREVPRVQRLCCCVRY